ncbi:FAD-dependent oxidoreductase [Agrobacterium vitis]|uniref:FAD-dependent oxidoreductase n=1 Tax=Rhizobium/Agrobacterium group TaxID=227290 RepID=UPI0008DBF51A|nr:FAD-dependent oxidoreductase [Agrobacterium vitis]MCF1436843.1 FAD-dependent oxidoreductase [Allorhizobium ampelinum]MUO92323.1 FAD-dependent oxidoreductase [Agrobacterium vitis]MUZ55144.1 FAD-dependent oxidoreductase [Agrobacterium vitis]MUZ94279.1 FAD-dependent oxidoreductase [Agrobacterium vitis]MVA43199.1 FAD-dependent oxidoreductase [Agrobacterium vitis]
MNHQHGVDNQSPIQTFSLNDIVGHFRNVVKIYEKEPHYVFDTVIVGGGIAGAGVLRDLSSRGNASALLCERSTFGSSTSSKSGKAIHPGIRYLRMSFHRVMLAFKLRKDATIKQSTVDNLRSAWLDLKLVWHGTRERMVLVNTSTGTVDVHPNLVFVYDNSPEKKWPVFFGILIYELFTTLWSFSHLKRRYGRVAIYSKVERLKKLLPFLSSTGLKGAIQYWDGKTSNDQTLVIKTLRDAVHRAGKEHPIYALCRVELVDYAWHGDDGCFHVHLRQFFDVDDLPKEVVVKAHTLTNASGPWIDHVRNRTSRPDQRTTVIYSRGTHVEVTNKFIHQQLSDHPEYRVGLVPLNAERQHYLRPFFQNGIWYIQCTTTDRYHTDPDKVLPERDEIEELMSSYNHLVTDEWKISEADIFNVFVGVRPLPYNDPNEISVQNISRMFRVNEVSQGDGAVFDLVNVKLTEYRWAGQDVGRMIKRNLQKRGIKTLGSSTTLKTAFTPVPEESKFAINSPQHPVGDMRYLEEKITHYAEFQALNCYTDYMMNFGGLRDAVGFNELGKCDFNWDIAHFSLETMSKLLGWPDARTQREWERFIDMYRDLFTPIHGSNITQKRPETNII